MFTLTAFSMRSMLPLRAAAIGGNFCFIGFGYLEGTLPILTLHAILLPCNLIRLRQVILVNREAARQNEGGHQVEMASTYPLRRNTSACANGVVAVATVDHGSNEFALGLSDARPAQDGAREIGDLRAEIAVLREQLRKCASEKALAQRSPSDERATLEIEGVAPFRRGKD